MDRYNRQLFCDTEGEIGYYYIYIYFIYIWNTYVMNIFHLFQCAYNTFFKQT